MKMWLERMPEPMRGYGTHGPSPEERGREIAETLLEGIPPDESALCVIEGELQWPVRVTLDATRIVLPGNNTLSGSLVRDSRVGIQIG